MKDPKYERLKAIGVDFGGPKQEKKPWMEQYQSLVGKLPATACCYFFRKMALILNLA